MIDDGRRMMLEQARLYGVNEEITQMAKIKYVQMKYSTQRLICRTLCEHNGMVMQKLKEDGSKKKMFNHIKRLIRKQEQKKTGVTQWQWNNCEW